MNKLFKKHYPHLIALVVFIVICIAYFIPQLQGKKLRQSDIIMYKGASQEVMDYKEKTGNTSLWTNSMFGGMPTYQIVTISKGNLLKKIEKIVRLGFRPPIGLFLVSMISFYIMGISFGWSPWLSIIGAVGFGLTTNNILIYEAGHETKLRATSYLPLVVAGIHLAYSKRYILGGALFSLGLGLSIMSNHVQMTYYFCLTLLFWGVFQIIALLRKKDFDHLYKYVGIMLVGIVLAIGASASNLLPTYQFQKDTIRGGRVLESQNANNSLGNTGERGLSWDYAMQWSNGGIDVFSSIIPGVAGGGSSETIDSDSETYRSLKRQGYNLPSEFDAPLYWGKLPFTSGPIYFGAVLFLLFLWSSLVIKGPIRNWIIGGVVLTILISMGKNFEFFNKLMFDYFPLFDKFRTPNSVLGITGLLIPILGIYGVNNLTNKKIDEKKAIKALFIASGAYILICLFFVLGNSIFDFSNPSDVSRAPFTPEGLINDRKSLMVSDSLRTIVFILLSSAILYGYIKKKLKMPYMFLGIGLLVIFDLWSVDRRYLDKSDFISQRDYINTFVLRDVDKQILQDTSMHYRVFDMTSSPFNSSMASYIHKSIGGNSAAKLQRYQDVIERHLAQNNMNVFNMLNTKYFIVQQGENVVAQLNSGVLGNAWFVGDYKMVNSNEEEIDALTDFNPSQQAIVNNEFQDYLSGFNPENNGSIRLTAYSPNVLEYSSSSNSDQLAVFSEIWYGPNKGWKAYIDGNPVDHIRVNYILRGMKIPQGNHTIRFEFNPQVYKTGVLISYLCSGLILLSLLFYIFKDVYPLLPFIKR